MEKPNDVSVIVSDFPKCKAASSENAQIIPVHPPPWLVYLSCRLMVLGPRQRAWLLNGRSDCSSLAEHTLRPACSVEACNPDRSLRLLSFHRSTAASTPAVTHVLRRSRTFTLPPAVPLLLSSLSLSLSLFLFILFHRMPGNENWIENRAKTIELPKTNGSWRASLRGLTTVLEGCLMFYAVHSVKTLVNWK